MASTAAIVQTSNINNVSKMKRNVKNFMGKRMRGKQRPFDDVSNTFDRTMGGQVKKSKKGNFSDPIKCANNENEEHSSRIPVKARTEVTKKASGKPRLTEKTKSREFFVPVPKRLETDDTFDLSCLKQAFPISRPNGVIDIDEDETDLFLCKEYSQDVVNYLQDLEHKYKLGPDFLDNCAEVTPKMREILVDWLLQVEVHLEIQSQTIHMAIAMLDIFTSRRSIGLDRYQLLGITCLFIAAKFEERFPPEIDTLTHLTDGSYTKDQVLKMEILVLKVLRFSLHMPNPMVFVERYLKAVRGSDQDSTVRNLSFYFMDLMLSDATCVQFSSSMKAAAAVHLASSILMEDSESKWAPNLRYYSTYAPSELKPCMQRMAVALTRAVKGRKMLQGAMTKFSSRSRHGAVGQMTHLANHRVVISLAVEGEPTLCTETSV
ncbi:G2/mitotic-specific cyclin-B [Lingula anatina]|uniref:G2/mitotic-specific cyclin-B n=1 Tax=Lingula anatina TaxID=7574 RepID=A0A1S3JBB4_LINAN|nr:G2/mitotic-specific cyclin-B [Lingula anatina]|eukprot:XP_013407692.1 G2/mitotic-specific cyclin-B [Lingula anatina]